MSLGLMVFVALAASTLAQKPTTTNSAHGSETYVSKEEACRAAAVKFAEGKRLYQNQSAASYPAAVEVFQHAASAYHYCNDSRQEAEALNWIGLTKSRLGQKQEALKYYGQALPIRREVGDRAGEATTLNNLGSVYDDLGQKQEALKYYEQALNALRNLCGFAEKLKRRSDHAHGVCHGLAF